MSKLFLFNSVSEFGKVCEDMPRQLFKRYAWSTNAFGGDLFHETLRKCQAGDTTHVEAAQRMLERVTEAADLATLRHEYQPAVCGAFPCVPDYLAGIPEAMRARSEVLSNRGPIKIFNCTSSSSVSTPEKVIERGIVILALAIALSAYRPVSLYVFDVNDEANVAVRLQTSPVCLSELCYALVDHNFNRALLYGFIHWQGFDVCWPTGIVHRTHAEQVETCRKLVNADAGDLIIPPSLSNDSELERDPVQWVIDRLREYKTEEE